MNMHQKVTVGGVVVAGLKEVTVAMRPQATLQGHTLVPVEITVVFVHTDSTPKLQAVFDQARQRVSGQPEVTPIAGGVKIYLRPAHQPRATPSVLEFARAVFALERSSCDGRHLPTYTWLIKADYGNYTSSAGESTLDTPFVASDMAVYGNPN